MSLELHEIRFLSDELDKNIKKLANRVEYLIDCVNSLSKQIDELTEKATAGKD